MRAKQADGIQVLKNGCLMAHIYQYMVYIGNEFIIFYPTCLCIELF